MKVNNNKVMCHHSIKFSDMFDQNPPYSFDKISEKPIPLKTLSQLDRKRKGQGHSNKQ